MSAASKRFAEHGYSAATIRDIAADAGVAPALVYHFFPDKERLFVAALRFPVVPSEIFASLTGPKGHLSADGVGEMLVRTFLQIWEVTESRTILVGILRSALTNEKARTMLTEFFTETIINVLARELGTGREPVGGDTAESSDRRYRASLVASQVLGIGLARYILEFEPIATASIDDLADAVGPTIQRYLTGAFRRPPRD